jgi:hypothetical protein
LWEYANRLVHTPAIAHGQSRLANHILTL